VIVADWWEARQRGEDALMIAKLNSERGHLNARARELLAAEGRIGTEEIEVAGRRFAAGDEVITRVNDQRAGIYNRERWRIEAVDAESRRMRLAGIDTDRLVGVDPGYLERVNPADGAPAIEHGYAATIYQAQGTTLDSAFVIADPSMDRQEFYVAASRTREETFFYATPEIGFDRVEFAPSPPNADALEHISRAAERDGAQVAAHDAALRERLGQLSTEELCARRRELASEAGAERMNQQHRDGLEHRLAESRDRLEWLAERRQELGEEPPRWARAERAAHREQSAMLAAQERRSEEAIARLEQEVTAAPVVEHDARAERAVTEHLIAERLYQRLAAIRIEPPEYIIKELGERPADPAERPIWDRAVAGIEGYREEHGIRDRDSTLGPRPESVLARRQQEQARESVSQAQMQLGLDQAPAIERTVGHGIEM
jgi:hypothetical protein